MSLGYGTMKKRNKPTKTKHKRPPFLNKGRIFVFFEWPTDTFFKTNG